MINSDEKDHVLFEVQYKAKRLIFRTKPIADRDVHSVDTWTDFDSPSWLAEGWRRIPWHMGEPLAKEV